MSAQGRTVPLGAKIAGTVVIIVLPWVAAAVAGRDFPHPFSALGYTAVFLLVSVAAQFGLVLRRWGKIRVWPLLYDLVVAVVAGAISFGVVNIAARRGGGPVDPSLVAIVLAYLLAIWSGQSG